MGNILQVRESRPSSLPGTRKPRYSEWAPHVDLNTVDLSKIDSYWGHLVFKDPKLMRKLFPAPPKEVEDSTDIKTDSEDLEEDMSDLEDSEELEDEDDEEAIKLLDDKIELMEKHLEKLKEQERFYLNKITQCEKELDSQTRLMEQNRNIYNIELRSAQRQLRNLNEEVRGESAHLNELVYKTECNYDESRQLLDKIAELECQPKPFTMRQWWAISIACFGIGVGIGLLSRWLKH